MDLALRHRLYVVYQHAEQLATSEGGVAIPAATQETGVRAYMRAAQTARVKCIFTAPVVSFSSILLLSIPQR
jgi:hypothetical protein